MVSLQKICAALSECYPPQCAESWDNPGLLLGRNRAEIRRVVVALELTPEVVEEAIETRAELIVTHHPFIFKPMSSLTDSSPDGRMMLDLAAAGIALYATQMRCHCHWHYRRRLCVIFRYLDGSIQCHESDAMARRRRFIMESKTFQRTTRPRRYCAFSPQGGAKRQNLALDRFGTEFSSMYFIIWRRNIV